MKRNLSAFPFPFAVFLLLSLLCCHRATAQQPVSHADVMPLFQGAEAAEFVKWVKAHCAYPAEALNEEISGRVNFSFVVDTKGKVTDVFIINSPHQSLSWEVMSVVERSPKWTPGKTGKRKVPVIFYMHIDFEIRERFEADSAYEHAKFEGGYLPEFRNWLAGKMQYPPDAFQKNVQGKVIASFVIDKDGSLTNIEIVYSPHDSLSAAVKNALKKSPKWTPATLNGEPMKIRYNLPVEFKLPQNDPFEQKTPKPKIFGPVY